MAKLLGNVRPDPYSIDNMLKQGGTWYAYQNQDIGSATAGHLRYLKCGPGCVYEKPPERYPDTPGARGVIGWRYVLVGKVNFTKRTIEDV